jgi:5-methylcytosine-specific restriction enzyme A
VSWGTRSVSYAELYNTKRWQRLRAKVMKDAANLCVNAGKDERCQLLATEVDHKARHNGNRSAFFDRANLQAMCRSCHGRKTYDETHRAPLSDENGMPTDPNHHWNLED